MSNTTQCSMFNSTCNLYTIPYEFDIWIVQLILLDHLIRRWVTRSNSNGLIHHIDDWNVPREKKSIEIDTKFHFSRKKYAMIKKRRNRTIVIHDEHKPLRCRQISYINYYSIVRNLMVFRLFVDSDFVWKILEILFRQIFSNTHTHTREKKRIFKWQTKKTLYTDLRKISNLVDNDNLKLVLIIFSFFVWKNSRNNEHNVFSSKTNKNEKKNWIFGNVMPILSRKLLKILKNL